MLIDPRIGRMAHVLVNYSLEVKPGQTVTVSATAAALPLVQAVYSEVLSADARPYVLLEAPGTRELLLRHGTDEQLARLDPYMMLMVEKSDAVLDIKSEENTRGSGGIDPARQALYQKGQSPIRAANMKRILENRPRCLTLFPTNAYAQDAEMSLTEFEDFVFHACLLDGDEDAIERWREVSRSQQKVVDWLVGKRTIRVEGPETDLSMSIEGRNFINSDGKRNFPSGEVFTSPVHDSVSGHIYFNYPTSYGGPSVRGVRLQFERGRVATATAEEGEDFLTSMLDVDEGARRLGEFAIGTNRGVDRITRNVLFDEKMAGSIHCALGAAYPNAGGTNQSAIHWDIVKDLREGRVTVDGEVAYENGEFVI